MFQTCLTKSICKPILEVDLALLLLQILAFLDMVRRPIMLVHLDLQVLRLALSFNQK
jgi:hypothetical protein